MEKSKIIFYILFLLFFLFSCRSYQIVGESNGSFLEDKKIVRFDTFGSKGEIMNAISAHIIKDTISFDYIKDTIGFDYIEECSVFIVEACYTYGISSSTIYVFMGSTIGNSTKEVWRLVCVREILTDKIWVVFDVQQREIVFKTIKGKTVMVLPFGSFSSSLDQ